VTHAEKCIGSVLATLLNVARRPTCVDTGTSMRMKFRGPITRAGVPYRYTWMNSDACFR
jgi:hypothetical protein